MKSIGLFLGTTPSLPLTSCDLGWVPLTICAVNKDGNSTHFEDCMCYNVKWLGQKGLNCPTIPLLTHIIVIVVIVVVVLGFELRALPLLGRCSTIWIMPVAVILLWLFWKQDFTFCPGWPGRWFYFNLSAIAEMTVYATISSLYPLKWGSAKLFCLGWPGTKILPISASYVAWDGRPVPLSPVIGSQTFCPAGLEHNPSDLRLSSS
jgi:hypothetical protein